MLQISSLFVVIVFFALGAATPAHAQSENAVLFQCVKELYKEIPNGVRSAGLTSLGEPSPGSFLFSASRKGQLPTKIFVLESEQARVCSVMSKESFNLSYGKKKIHTSLSDGKHTLCKSEKECTGKEIKPVCKSLRLWPGDSFRRGQNDESSQMYRRSGMMLTNAMEQKLQKLSSKQLQSFAIEKQFPGCAKLKFLKDYVTNYKAETNPPAVDDSSPIAE